MFLSFPCCSLHTKIDMLITSDLLNAQKYLKFMTQSERHSIITQLFICYDGYQKYSLELCVLWKKYNIRYMSFFLQLFTLAIRSLGITQGLHSATSLCRANVKGLPLIGNHLGQPPPRIIPLTFKLWPFDGRVLS